MKLALTIFCLVITATSLVAAQQGQLSDDSVVMVTGNDPEMLAAEQKARNTVDHFISQLQQPKPSQTIFSVKGAFSDGHHVEYMWLTGVRYADGNFTGTVNNVPQLVRNVRFGQQLKIPKSEINDWLIIENNEMVGGYTAKVLMKRQSAGAEAPTQPVDSASEPTEFKHDFATPQGAILCLEDAYRAKDIEAAVKCKDFTEEAKVTIKNIDPEMGDDPDLIQKTAEALESAFRRDIIANGFPNMAGVEGTFIAQTPLVGHNHIVVVTVKFNLPTGESTQQKILVAKTDDGWRVLNPQP